MSKLKKDRYKEGICVGLGIGTGLILMQLVITVGATLIGTLLSMVGL